MVQGPHLLGRIDHVPVPGDGRNLADPERMAEITARLKLVHCVLESGDAVFCHSNTLHRSKQNRSPHLRWAPRPPVVRDDRVSGRQSFQDAR